MLCGRESEIRRIDQVLDDAQHGRSGVILFCGEAGIGKTALLEYAEAAAANMRVLRVRGFEPEQPLAFGGLSQVFHPLTDEIAMLPEMQASALGGALALGPPVAGDRFAVYAATLGILAQLAERCPVLLMVDDIHWLDAPSAEALTFAARRLVAENIAVLVTTRHSRPEDGPDWQLPTCVLGGLDDQATTRLIESRAAVTPSPDVVAHLRRGTAGNPMALLETLTRLTSAQLTGRESYPSIVPADLTAGALFAPRIAALDTAARDALLLLAISRSSMMSPVKMAVRNLFLPSKVFLDIEDSRLVVFESGSFKFTHPLVRAATTAAASPARQRQAHRALAEVLTESEQMNEKIWHLAEATLGPDERVAADLEKIADTTRDRSGYASAVPAFERAAALSESMTSQARRLFLAADTALLAGQSTRARDLLIRADALTDDLSLRGAVAASRGRVELFTGHPSLACRVVRDAAGALRRIEPQRSAELLIDSAIAALLAGDAVAAVDATNLAEQVMSNPKATAALVIKVVRGLTFLHTGDLIKGSRLLQQAMVITTRDSKDSPRAEYVILCGLGMYWIGMHELALRILPPVVDRLRSSGAIGLLPFALAVLAYCEARLGRINGARSLATEAVNLAQLSGHGFWRYLTLGALAHVEAVRGDEDDCRAHAEQALALKTPDTDYPHDAVEALALLELGLGRYDHAIASFRRDKPAADTARPEESHPDMIEARIRSGSPLLAPATDALTTIDSLAMNTTLPLQAAVAWRLKGLLADGATFPDCFATAVELHAQVDCPFEKARTLLAYGERLRRAGQRIRAREQLRSALDIFTAMPAAHWAVRAQQELAATGEARHSKMQSSGLDTLTPQEYQVARAVVTGATNRDVASLLFLSTKTVEFHLSNVYRKLGLRTRTELGHRFPDLRG